MDRKGISDLQNYQFTNISPKDQPVAKIYQFFHTQHTACTAVLLGILTLLKGELVKLDPSNVSPLEIP